MTIFAIHRAEYRYRAVGDAVERHLEPNAVILTVLHSGSIRLYSGRMTIRWDLIEPDNLDFTLTALREGGYVPYLVLDEWEEPVFHARFARSAACHALARAPLATFTDVSTARLYALPVSAPPRGSQTSQPCVSRKS